MVSTLEMPTLKVEDGGLSDISRRCSCADHAACTGQPESECKSRPAWSQANSSARQRHCCQSPRPDLASQKRHRCAGRKGGTATGSGSFPGRQEPLGNILAHRRAIALSCPETGPFQVSHAPDGTLRRSMPAGLDAPSHLRYTGTHDQGATVPLRYTRQKSAPSTARGAVEGGAQGQYGQAQGTSAGTGRGCNRRHR